MTDLVKKYQHYLNESVKLQETVNEQLAYIAELEDAILELSEEPEIYIPFTNTSISWGKEGELLKKADAKLAKLRKKQDAAKRTGSTKIEDILGEIEKQKGLDEMAMTADYKKELYKGIKTGNNAAMKAYVRAMHSLKVHDKGGKVVGKVTGKSGESATDLLGKRMGSVDAEGVVIPKGKKK
jgi:hypothetical protein